MNGIVFNIQKYSIHDGPGIRTSVFLKGCPLRCQWCHNPESFALAPELIYYENKCTGCGACIEACPQGALSLEKGHLKLDQDRCQKCFRCAHECLDDALLQMGKTMSVAAVMEEVLKDRPFYEASGGGITFSGGEALLQGPFLKACLESAKGHGLHTTLDTSGFAKREVIEEISPLVDLFLYDLKAFSEADHLALTGVSNASILENLKYLSDQGKPLWIRIPLIKGYNDDLKKMEDLAKFIKTLQVAQVHLLPYHSMGSEKYGRLLENKRPYAIDKTLATPQEKDSKIIQSIFENYHIKCVIGGE